MTSESSTTLLEQGQVIKLRHKTWAINGVKRTRSKDGETLHRLSLECLSDDGLGKTIEVIFEREVAPQILTSTSLPPILGIDSPERFQAFLDSLRWSSASLIEGTALQAPFRGGVEIEEYQLVPVSRAVKMPRVSLLIADDVGLGKTVEAGLIAQELIHTHRANRILVVCPAHLKSKWLDEMSEKFGLEFRIIDRDTTLRMRREFGPTINPWASFPRLITSLDYLKTEQPRRQFEELLDKERRDKGLKPWDLLILDEAHNVAPSGRGQYVRDSDRTALLRAISNHFEHKLFLTATPHNGYRESFTGLLELLDDLRFSRGPELDRAQLNAVTVRRLKEEIRLPDGSPRFPPRVILPIDETRNPDLYVDLSSDEAELFSLLDHYTKSRLTRTEKPSERATQFVLTMLKKRALSSAMAIRESLVTHAETAGVKEELAIGDSLFRKYESKSEDDWGTDEEKEETETAALQSASQLISRPTAEESGWLKRMYEIADKLKDETDSKADALIRWIESNLKTDDTWNNEKVIVFTEYKHTLEYLQTRLNLAGFGEHLVAIYGGMPEKERDEHHSAFQSPPECHPARILLATDAASEGGDFQLHCRNLFHYEIPWNPVRMQQRNGRIDRHGQKANEIRIHHFVYRNHEDSEFLKKIVEKVEAIRTDLGSVGALIADHVRQHSLGNAVDLTAIDRDAHREAARREMTVEAQEGEDVASLVRILTETRSKLGITSDRQLSLLQEAIAVEGESVSIQKDGDLFYLNRIPASWTECYKFKSSDDIREPLTFERANHLDSANKCVLHLDHPLMRRAISTLRSQMWALPGDSGTLFRVAAMGAKVETPTILAWGRLVLLGPERNILHEGIYSAVIRIDNNGSASPDSGDFESSGFTPISISISELKDLVTPHLSSLDQQLRSRAHQLTESLTEALSSRGTLAERQARGLFNDRMAEIRRTIRQWEKQAAEATLQPSLFDTLGAQQREHDLVVLQKRLEELDTQRETEPTRQKALYRVSEERVFPIALQILLPNKGLE